MTSEIYHLLVQNEIKPLSCISGWTCKMPPNFPILRYYTEVVHSTTFLGKKWNIAFPLHLQKRPIIFHPTYFCQSLSINYYSRTGAPALQLWAWHSSGNAFLFWATASHLCKVSYQVVIFPLPPPCKSDCRAFWGNVWQKLLPHVTLC